MISRIASTHALWIAATLIAIAALLIYLPFQSISLDDLDSFNFAVALTRFDPRHGTPHPPGYVLYIGAGRLFLGLVGDPRLALTLFSATAAALACGLLFALARTLFNARVGLYAVLLILATPVMWLNAAQALSDAPGLLVQVICAGLIASSARRKIPLWTAGVGLGIAAGFRPQGVLGLVAALLLTALWLRCRPSAWLAAALAVVLGTLTWLLPLLATFDGDWGALQDYFSGATSFVAAQESLFATTLSTQSVVARWGQVWFWGSQAIWAPLTEWLRVALALGALSGAGWACARHIHSWALWFCLAWLLPQLGAHLLFLNPTLTRYLLACLFPAAILVAAGLDALPRRWGLSLALLSMGIVGNRALPLAQGLHTIYAPPEQAAAYIAARLDPQQTVIVARQSYNALQYHLPGWDVRFEEYWGIERLEQEFAQGRFTYIVIADPESLRLGEQYVEIETRTLVRDPQIHAKHARVEVNLYGRADRLTLPDFALPESGTIAIGAPQDAKYLLEGWYRREEIGGVIGRWTGSEISATLRIWMPQSAQAIVLRAWSFAPDQVLEVWCDGRLMGQAAVPQAWSEVKVALQDCGQSDRLTWLALRPRVRLSPAQDGRSTDQRRLGIAVSEIRLEGGPVNEPDSP